MRCRRDHHHDRGVSASPYPPRTRRVPSAFVRWYETDRVASCSSRLVQQGLGSVARRVLEQCSGMLDLARSFPVGKGKPDTVALPDLVVEISVQEGRQGRGLLDDRQTLKSATLAHPKQIKGHAHDKSHVSGRMAARILSFVACSGHI